MPPSALQKAWRRARGLRVDRLAAFGIRRTRSALRARWGELVARRLQLTRPAELGLPPVVVGAKGQNLSQALAALEARAGQLPVPSEQLPAALAALERHFPDAAAALISGAERACQGEWQLLGFPAVVLGRTPDWHTDFVSGERWDPALPGPRQPVQRAPGSDVKVPWEVSRLQHLPALALAFRLRGAPRYLALFQEQVDDWIAANPPYLGVNWRCAMEVGLRAVSLSWAFELLRRSTRLADDFRARVYWSLFAHGQFLRHHLEDGGSTVGNHFLADCAGLAWLGALYPGLRGAAGWRRFGVEQLAAQIPAQIGEDGGSTEGSTGYHRLVAELYGLAASVAEPDAEPAAEPNAEPAAEPGGAARRPLAFALARMAHFSAKLARPDGTVPQLGDQDGGRAFRWFVNPPSDHRPLIGWGALVAGDSQLAAAAAPTPELLFLAGPEAVDRHRALAAEAGGAPAILLTRLRSSGLTVFHAALPATTADEPASARLGPRELVACLSASPVGQHGHGGHGHNGTLALELWLAGPLIADPGSFTYTRDPAARNRYRSIAAHATAQVDGGEPNPLSDDLFYLPERAHPHLVHATAVGGRLRWKAEHRGYAPLQHRREVHLDPLAGIAEITDELGWLAPVGQGAPPATHPKSHLFTVRFPFAPGVTVERLAEGLLLHRRGLPPVRLSSGAQLSVDHAGYAPNYGAEVAVAVARCEARGPAPLVVRTRLEWAV